MERLKELCQLNGIPITDKELKKFEVYRELLKKWGRRINLTSILTDREIEEKHFFDSLLGLLAFKKIGIEVNGKSFCDVGSGAGFPGIPLAVLLKDSEFTLVEPRKKRCVFLEEVKRQLRLKNISVWCSRIEGINEDFDILTMRAVEDPLEAVEITEHLLERGALLCIYRGKEVFGRGIPGYRVREIEIEPQSINFKRHFLFVEKEE